MFNQIVAVDDVALTEGAISKIKKYSKNPARFYDNDPESTEEVIKRIGNSDCVLVSWRTKITKEIFENCKNIKYIGICGTSSSNISLEEAKKRGIVVSNVGSYGDEAPAEYIFYQLLSLARGFGKYQWKEMPCELFEKTLGIVGLGAVGSEVAKLGLGFRMKVIYYDITRKPEFEKKGLRYLELDELIEKSDIISIHVPKDTKILAKKELGLIPKGTILVDTCLGKVFDIEDFVSWINKGENFAIFDYSVSEEYYKKFKDLKNVIFPKVIGGRTLESKKRLSMQVVKNIQAFF